MRYVALLAFNKIVVSHAYLVSQHEDVIMSCIDDSDISIRLQALELGVGMVNSNNLVAVVERLMLQLTNDDSLTNVADPTKKHTLGIEPSADSDSEDPEATLRRSRDKPEVATALPVEYKFSVIRQMLDMCSKDTYANVSDFYWYLEILVQLVGLVPSTIESSVALDEVGYQSQETSKTEEQDVASAIGRELRNVSVRVSTIRNEAVISAKSLITIGGSNNSFTKIGVGGHGVLRFAVWILGEFASSLNNAQETLEFLIHPIVQSLPSTTISAYLQAIPKVLVSIISDKQSSWNKEHKVMLSLLLTRIIHFFEPLTSDPNLEVQERSVEFVELMRVAVQAIESHENDATHGPLLLTKAVPSLFIDSDLNPVAPTAQKKVPPPSGMDLDAPLHRDLWGLLHSVDYEYSMESDSAEFHHFYNQRVESKVDDRSASHQKTSFDLENSSYRQVESIVMDPEILAKKRMERWGRNKDDPFYIMSDEISSGTSTPFHEILKSNNGDNVDVDSIPIMKLDLGDAEQITSKVDFETAKRTKDRSRNFSIAMDENIDDEDSISQYTAGTGRSTTDTNLSMQRHDKFKKSLLEVDSSGLGQFSINGDAPWHTPSEIEVQNVEDAEMAKALEEVERLRLEMQRAAERIGALDGIPPEGTLVKKKKKHKKVAGKSKKTVKAVEDVIGSGNEAAINES